MPKPSPKADRRPGGQPGNKNAVKPEKAKRVTIRLYDSDKALIVAIAKKLEISQNEAHRQAIQMLAKSLGLSG